MHFHLATLLALPALSLAALFSENIGCYSQILSIQSVAKFDYQSREWCLDYCDTNNATYAALNFGSKCSCTNTLPRDAAKVDDDKCDVACRGWPEDTCGGRGYWTFLSTGGSTDTSSDSDSDSSSNSNSASDSTSASTNSFAATSIAPETASATPAASTAGGGILVAANPSTMATSTATHASSNASGTAITKASNAAASTAGSSASSASPSPSHNAAGTLRAGPAAGIVLAGLGLIL